MKAAAIIPARFESTRFPGKPLALIQGESLIQRTYKNARRCPRLERVIIATDDQRIFDHVKGFGAEVVMTSPHCFSGSDRLSEVVRDNRELDCYDIVVNVQGDEPCLDPHAISQLIDLLENNKLCVASTLISLLKKEEGANSSIVKCVKNLKDEALYFSRAIIPFNRHPKEGIVYYRHVGIYAYQREFLLRYHELAPTPLQLAEDLEQLKILEHGYSIKVGLTTSSSIEVNHPEDIEKVEQFLCTQNLFS